MAIVLASLLLFAAIFTLRLALRDPGEGVALLYVIPISLLAVEFGTKAGLAAALGAIGLLLVSAAIEHPGFGALGYLTRMTAFFVSGAFVGGYADRSRRALAAEERAAAELHDYQAQLEHATERRRLVAQALEAEAVARRRISETLHDSALQTLLAARQELGDDSRGHVDVERSREALADGIKQLREAVWELHPVVLKQEGLDTALQAIARGAERQGHFRCSVRVEPGATGVHDELTVSLCRELLRNAVKHSRASKVSVSVERAGSDVVLIVADNGRGIPPGRREAAVREGHIGLAASNERLAAIGGALEVSSGQKGGVIVRATFPARSTDPAKSGADTAS